MIDKSANNIKANEMRIIHKKFSELLKIFGLSVKEIYFVGSRVNLRARKNSDLDVVILPKIRTWNNAQEYTLLMRGIEKYSTKIKFRGNNIDLQVTNSFNPGDSFGECYIRLKDNIIKKTCPKGESHYKN